MRKKDRINKENRIRNSSATQNRSRTLESRELAKSRNRRIKSQKRRKLFSKFVFVAIVAGVIYFAYNYKEKMDNQDLENGYIREYYTEDYDRNFKLYSNDIYYQKHIKDEESGLYTKLEPKDYIKNSKTKRNMEYYLFEKINEILDEYDIKQEDFYLSIKSDDYIIGINENKEIDGVSLTNLSTLNAVAKGLNEGAITRNDKISITREDISQGSNIYSENSIGTEQSLDFVLETASKRNDPVSYNMLKRYISSKGYSVSSYKANLLGREASYLSVKESIQIFEDYRRLRNEINAYYNNILDEDDSLFQNSIYSNIPNKNILFNDENMKFDVSYVDGEYPFYYSIYSDKLSEQQIRYIGDIVNRTISEVNLVKTVQQ